VWSQQAYLKASNTEAGDWFGYAVATDGDTVVVGARREDSAAIGVNGNQLDNSATDSGAAYVFTRTEGMWSQQAYLKASNTEAGDKFGLAVAISGDTIVVGAFFEDSAATGINGNQADNSTPDSGVAYVFTRTAGMWSQQAYLKASNTDGDDLFGVIVAVDGDTIVVGAWGESSAATGVNGNQTDNSASAAGAAYLFTRTAGTWRQDSYLKASNTTSSAFFGSAVAVSGDTIVIGAYGESSAATGVNGNQMDDSAFYAGAVYVFGGCRRSAQSGKWGNGATWIGGVAPLISDGVCIENGHTVTMEGNQTISRLWVYPGGTLDLGLHQLTVSVSVSNKGTLRQTKAVDKASVEFLHIQNMFNTVTHYRGVVVDATGKGGNNLGDTTVSVRELNRGEYCTATGADSPAYAQRCFDISPAIQPITGVLVRLYGRTADELNGIAPANLAVYRNVPAGSAAWVEETGAASVGSSGGYSYAQATVDGFSAFLLGETGQMPTAVTWQSFFATSRSPVLPWLALTFLLILLTGATIWRAQSRH
jgi:uncharacterized membrane protein